MVTIDGHWYLDAYCHRAGRHAALPGRPDRCGRDGSSSTADAGRRCGSGRWRRCSCRGPGAVEVHLQLGPAREWVPESVPVRAVARDDDGTVTDVVLDVSGMAWFERLLLQLGPAARVVSPPELTGLAADAARRVLARYRRLSRASASGSVAMADMNDFNRGVIDEFRANHGAVGGAFAGAPGRAADHHGRPSGEKRVNPARRPPRGRRPLRGRLQGGSARPTRTGTTTWWPIPRSRSSSATSASTPSPPRSPAPSGTASTLPRWRSSRASRDTRRPPTG